MTLIVEKVCSCAERTGVAYTESATQHTNRAYDNCRAQDKICLKLTNARPRSPISSEMLMCFLILFNGYHKPCTLVES